MTASADESIRSDREAIAAERVEEGALKKEREMERKRRETREGTAIRWGE